MDAYFYDVNNRYIGKRTLNSGENIPANATSKPVTLADDKEAHFINGEWAISDITETDQIEPCEPSIECRLEAAEAVIMEMLTMMM